ncbi:CIC11C00000002166 [Sungouiella intermedia]|uniref:CIC11C00000002166 n=1 Tax=Sungouiella intermedia TaxID=45354 RepID=A0A1L0DQG0_9ASCO|nr:CIC11C00000002166 [[Candida] intermedia]
MPDTSFASDFQNQRYPTVEETVRDNASVLYKRKKFFLQDVRKLAGTLGYVLIGLVYLRDRSISLFLSRTLVQHYLSDPFPPPLHLLLDTANQEDARSYAKLVFIMTFNASAIIFHFFFGDTHVRSGGDGLLHGGLTVQFIGERLPTSVWELVFLDCLILLDQLLYHGLTCGVDDAEILHIKSPVIEGDDNVCPEVVSNGYNGNVTLVTLDIFAHFKKVLLFRAQPLQFAMNRSSMRLQQTDPQVSGLLFSREMAERMA